MWSHYFSDPKFSAMFDGQFDEIQFKAPPLVRLFPVILLFLRHNCTGLVCG